MLKSILNVMFATAAVFITLLACNENKETAGADRRDSAATSTPTMVPANAVSRELAKEGDSVWVLVNHVKGDKKEQFERFIHEVFWDGSKKLSQEE